MRCPFLREARVKSCVASDIRKMIVRIPEQTAMERCSSPGYESCPFAKQFRSEVYDRDRCPFLQESLVQYCAAAPVIKYIPYTESTLSRCASERHAYCALYIAMADPGNGSGGGERPKETANSRSVAPPGDLWYSKNHMWLDIGAERVCHVGVDAFFAGLFETIDSIRFVTKRGHSAPEAVLSSGGMELRMLFPRRMMITGVNSYLGTNPSRLLRDPYMAGWLFEGLDMEEPSVPVGSPMSDGLIPGAEADTWITSEAVRMTSFVHELIHLGDGMGTMADGGSYQEKLFSLLDAGQKREMFERFFSPGVGERTVK